MRELPRAVLLYIPILVESGPADLERLLGEDDEILKRPSPLGAVGTGQLDLRLPDEMTRQHRLGSERGAKETDDRVAPVVRKLATAVRRRRVLHEELAQAVEILRVEQPRVPIFEALDRFDLDEVFRRHAGLPFSHLGLTV